MGAPKDDIARALETFWNSKADDAARAVSDDVIKGYGQDISPPANNEYDWRAFNRRIKEGQSGHEAHVTAPLDAEDPSVYGEYVDTLRGAELNQSIQRQRDAWGAQSRSRYARMATEGAGPDHPFHGVDVEDGWTTRGRIIGAAGTVAAGAAVLGASSAQAEPLFDDATTKRFLSAPKAKQDAILGKLTDAEYEELKAAVKRVKSASGPVDYSRGVPMLKSAGVQPPKQQTEAEAVQPYYDMIGPRTVLPESTMLDKAKGAYNATLGPAVDAFGKWQADNVTPVVKDVQGFMRENINQPTPVGAAVTVANPAAMVADVARTAANAVGPGAGHVLDRATQLFFGPPETYRTPEELAARSGAATANIFEPAGKAFAAAPLPGVSAVNKAVKASGADPATTYAAGAESLLNEASYLPLYLIDAPGKAGRLANALVGGGLSELLDPRDGSNALRGTLMAGGLGLTIEGLIKGVSKAGALADAAKAAAAAKWRKPDIAHEAAVLPVDVIRDAIATSSEKITKPTAAIADVDAFGNIKYKVVQIDGTGVRVEEKYAVDKSVPVDYTDRAKQAINQDKLAKAKLPQQLESVRLKASEGLRDAAAKTGPNEYTPIPLDANTGKPVFDDTVPTLDKLPNKDTLVVWDNGTGEAAVKKMSARDLQLESLRERGVVEVMTDEGPKLGLYRAADLDAAGKKQYLVMPFDASERMPNNLSAPVLVDKLPNMLIDDGPARKLVEALDVRDAQLAREAEEAADLAATPMVPEDLVPPNQVPAAPTTAGPSGAGLAGPPVNAAGGGAGSVPPGMPPSGGAGGTPPGIPPPQPLGSPIYPGTPAWQRWSSALVQQITNAIPAVIMNSLISPVAASSALDLSFAASSMKAAGLSDILGDRTAKAIQKATSPTFASLPPAQQAAVRSDITAFLTSKKTDLTQFAQKHPQIYADIKVQVEDFKARVQANEDEIKRLGLIPPKDMPSPDGFKAIVKAIMDDEAYLAKGYMTHLLDPGEYARVFIADQAKYQQVMSEAVKHFTKKNPARATEAIELEAQEAIDKLIKDPDTALDGVFMRPGYGRERIREKRAGTWDAAAKVLDVWNRANPQLASQAKRFVAGLTGAPPAGISAKDIKFLQKARDEFGEIMPPWVRMALGEIRDPFTLMPLTITRQEEILVRARGIEELARSGRIRARDSLLPGQSMPPDWTTTTSDRSIWGNYASTDAQTFYVHPDAKDAVTFFTTDLDSIKKLVNEARVIQDKTAVGKAFGKAYDIFRASKTSLSISAYWQNTFGLVRGMALSGVMRPSDVLSSKGDSWASVLDSYKQWRDFVDRPNKLSTATDKSGADWIREGITYGTIGSDWMSHEHKAILRNMGNTISANQGSFFARTLKAIARGNKVIGGAYAVPDQIIKHATWLAGLKRGGIDMKTGQLVDRDAAVKFIFGNGLNQRIMSRQQLANFPSDKLAEMVKRASAQRVAQSFAMPDRAGKLGQVAGAVGTATGGLLANPFVRTAMEETRILAQLPARMLTQSGVGKSMLEYGLLMAGLGVGINMLRRSNGVTKQSEQESFMGMPQGQRMYAPTATSVGLKDKQGRHMFVDPGKLFDPFKWVGGNPYGMPAGAEFDATPGRLMLRMAANATVNSVFGDDSPIGDMYKQFSINAGMAPPEKQFTAQNPGLYAASQPLMRYLAPGTVTQANSAVKDVQRGVKPEWALASFISGGLLKTGGTPQEGALNITKVSTQTKKDLPSRVKPQSVGKSQEGLFDSVDKEDVKQSIDRRINQNVQNINTTKKLRSP